MFSTIKKLIKGELKIVLTPVKKQDKIITCLQSQELGDIKSLNRFSKQAIANRLKEIREENKISQIEMSIILNISQSHLSKLESACAKLNDTILEDFTTHFNICIGYIMFGEMPKYKDTKGIKAIETDNQQPTMAKISTFKKSKADSDIETMNGNKQLYDRLKLFPGALTEISKETGFPLDSIRKCIRDGKWKNDSVMEVANTVLKKREAKMNETPLHIHS